MLPITLIFYPDKVQIESGAVGISELLVGEQVAPDVALSIRDSVTGVVMTDIAGSDSVYAEARLFHAGTEDVTSLYLAGTTRKLVEAGYVTFANLKVRGVVGSDFKLRFRLGQGFPSGCNTSLSVGCTGYCCAESSGQALLPAYCQMSNVCHPFPRSELP